MESRTYSEEEKAFSLRQPNFWWDAEEDDFFSNMSDTTMIGAPIVRKSDENYVWVLPPNPYRKWSRVEEVGRPICGDSFSDRLSSIINSTFSHINMMFEKSLQYFPVDWKDEGIEEPTQDCREYASRIANDLYYQEKIIPARIDFSVEDGIMLVYYVSNKMLIVEIYNDGDVLAAIKQGSDLIFNEELSDTITFENVFEALL